MRKIALITPMLQPYRLTFYDKLQKSSPGLDWMVYHGIKRQEDGRPAFTGIAGFKNTGLIEKKYRVGPFTILTQKGLLKSIKEFNPDMIIIQAITGNLSYRRVVNWASRNNKIIINWTCAWDPALAKGLLLSFKNWLVSIFFRKGHAFLTYSTKAIKYVVDRGVEASKITVCYNGLEIDDVIENESKILEQSHVIREKYGLNGYKVFIYVGGLLAEKRVDLLLEAYEKLKADHPRIKLLIIGDGPEKNNITGMISRLNDPDIIYLGRIIDGVDPYFAASTCLVLPGVGGLALNQAMLWRKICIASEADGTEEDLVVNGQTGFRFVKDDLKSLTAAMQRVIDLGDEEFIKMGNTARKFITEKSNVNNMVDIFISTVARFFPEIVAVASEKSDNLVSMEK